MRETRVLSYVALFSGIISKFKRQGHGEVTCLTSKSDQNESHVMGILQICRGSQHKAVHDRSPFVKITVPSGC